MWKVLKPFCLAIERNFLFSFMIVLYAILQGLFDWQIFVERILWVILFVSLVTLVTVLFS